MPLFETIPVDVEVIRQLARDHWGIELGECVKASQNHTFLANRSATERFALRVMPDPHKKRFDSTQLEVAFLDYLHENKLSVCPAVRSSITSSAIVCNGDLILCLFNYATGEPVVYTDWTWMTNREMVVGLGRWFAHLHQLSRRFTQEQPELAAHSRHWTTLHEGVLAEVEVHEGDKKTARDPAHFGVIHGDVNTSNYFWDSTLGMPCMFDWDQLQQSWFLYDLSAPIWAVVSLERGGMTIDQPPVSQANSQLYTAWLLEGYESEGDHVVVDREALHRMVMIRRELYRRFCRKALLELPPEHEMTKFCQSVTDFFDREEAETRHSEYSLELVADPSASE